MTSKPVLRAGLVGSGFASAFHYEALRRVYSVDVQVTGVYSLTKEKREAFARDKAVPCCDSLDALLEGCDVVHICVPPALHEPMTVKALEMGKYPIVEKPFTGYFGDGSAKFHGLNAPKQPALEGARASLQTLLEAEQKSTANILYAENWVYAPAVQKEKEIVEKTGAQILWMRGEEAHSGSHSPSYGDWCQSGGGSMMGKGCHPLSAALYLKQVEGRTRNGKPIRPQTVTGRIHVLTRSPQYLDENHLRRDYKDTEDFALAHIRFEDDTVADIFASEIIMGGVHNHLEVAANNHRTICNINPNDSMQTYNPVQSQFDDIYTVEKVCSKQGWNLTSPDEDWFHGYQHEMDAFYRAIAYGDPIESNSMLGADTILTLYSAYLSAEQKGVEVDIPLL